MAADDDDQEFDFASFIQSPMALMMSAVAAADTAKKTLSGLVEAVNSLQRSAKAFESILERIDTVVAQIEAPAKVLGPEMERLASRMAMVGDVFEKVPIDQLPDVVEQLVGQLTSVVGGLSELPKKLGPFGDLFGGASALMGLGRSTTKALISSTSSEATDEATSTRAKPVAKKASSKPKAASKKPAPKAAPKKKKS